ncbi:hypothetical protein N7453_010206 [Penicillium expansum]|nr:hypothetical protein N7453_010206 [Penicillium expansum]
MTKDNREAAAFIVYRALDLTCLYIPGAASHGPSYRDTAAQSFNVEDIIWVMSEDNPNDRRVLRWVPPIMLTNI